MVWLLPSDEGDEDVIYRSCQLMHSVIEASFSFVNVLSYRVAYLGIVLDVHSQAVQIILCLLRDRRTQPRQQLVRARDEGDLRLWVLRPRLKPSWRTIEILGNLASSLNASRSATSNHNRFRHFDLSANIGQSSLNLLMAIAIA